MPNTELKCNSNSSISKACTSLSLLLFPVAIDFVSNSPQEAGAGHSDSVAITWFTTNIQLIYFRCPFHLAIALHPSSLTPQSPKIFRWIRMLTSFTSSQTPPLMCRQPLLPNLFYPMLRSNHIAKSPPTSPRPPSRGTCSPFSPASFPLHIHKSTQPYFFEPPPFGSAEELARWVPHFVTAYFLTKVLR